MKIEYYNTTSNRQVQIDDVVTVRQVVELRDFTMKAPSINWAAIGSVSIERADEFMQSLIEAQNIARRWNEDKGRHYEEVNMEAH